MQRASIEAERASRLGSTVLDGVQYLQNMKALDLLHAEQLERRVVEGLWCQIRLDDLEPPPENVERSAWR